MHRTFIEKINVSLEIFSPSYAYMKKNYLVEMHQFSIA